jgi:formylglycine-generating enzyme required for sulfatase activity
MSWQNVRLDQIEENLSEALKLLAEYEREQRLTHDPADRLRYRAAIDRLKSDIAGAENERASLLSTPPQQRAVPITSTNCPALIVTREGREMVLVPEGEFACGPEQRAMSLSSFYIDRHPVTNADYQQFLDATQRPSPVHWPGAVLPQGKARHPVVNLTYSEALSYAMWAGKTLPAEEAWEKAARGADGRLWPWGHRFDSGLCSQMWRLPLEQRSTTIVGSFSPGGDSVFGVSDIGHLWEWTSSWLEPRTYKVVRGGPWRDVQEPPLIVNRSYEDDRAPDVGFQCACAMEQIAGILATVLRQ